MPAAPLDPHRDLASLREEMTLRAPRVAEVVPSRIAIAPSP